MDLREKKTKRSIYNAFLELRSKKPLEKITIKELSEKAEISKATFYLHYQDIYELSQQLQLEVLKRIYDSVQYPMDMFVNPSKTFKEIKVAFLANINMINILFSGKQEARLPILVENELMKVLVELRPELKDNPVAYTKMSFLIMGAFYSYLHNTKMFDEQIVSDTIIDMMEVYSFEK